MFVSARFHVFMTSVVQMISLLASYIECFGATCYLHLQDMFAIISMPKFTCITPMNNYDNQIESLKKIVW